VNKDLYGKQYKIPNNTLQHLKKYEANETINNLLSSGNVSYSLLKKMKHRMENGEKDDLGGDHMLGWVNHTLNSDRSGLDTSKKTKSDAGMSNTYNKPHSKSDSKNLNSLNRPSKNHHDFSSDIKITESLKRINEIISKII
jgi:hypothetical protein